eukprot:m.75868 g.75868  ORF g.75868 m.75868 type:complete len:90 (+) comp10462_c0_seq1:26-295(+)
MCAFSTARPELPSIMRKLHKIADALVNTHRKSVKNACCPVRARDCPESTPGNISDESVPATGDCGSPVLQHQPHNSRSGARPGHSTETR